MTVRDAEIWPQLREALKRELAGLPAGERRWLAGRLTRVAEVKEELHGLFLEHGGDGICAACHGDCCDRGTHHLTLVSLLGCLVAEKPLPDPDFSRCCPYLGDHGCHFDPPQRPFNCLTFLCDRIEGRMSPEALATFYRREKELRDLYREFERRYAGASPRGIFIRAARLGKVPLLAPASAVL